MNVWIPGLIVVAVGLVLGLWSALRGKSEVASSGGPEAPAAREGRDSTSRSTAREAFSRRSGLIGFVAGVASCLLIGSLVYWATQGSRPRDEPSPAAQPGAADPDHPEDTASAELSPQVAAQLQGFRAQVEAAPEDLDARRQLTVALLNANLLMEAFEQARELQRLSPNDPDGQFVEGVVRLAMGQWQLSIELMDRVLAQHPDHVLAFLAKGQAQVALEQKPQAIATWKQGLAAAGGRFQPLEELLAEAEATGASSPPARPAATASAGPTGAGIPAGAYRIRVELAPGAIVPPAQDGGPPTLFVALRGEAPGPPAAVQRVVNPTFPLELTLSESDSMIGQPLPERGNLSIRLDGDGNASTVESGDLAGALPAVVGGAVTVVLSAGGG